VNWQHLQTFLWLRWRLRVNQLKRGGTANAVILIILLALLALLSVILFIAFLLVGAFALPEEHPSVLLFVWDGLVVVFLAFWTISLIGELQRSEALSLEKFLHLPVSPTGAFLINYLSSLLSVNLMVFLPAMIGLSLGLVFARGPRMLLVLPLLAAFVLMVTALTYQFQGWLASLMANPRRRRTIIVLITMAFILLCQLPNLVNVLQPWNKPQADEHIARYAEQQAELHREFASGQITAEQYQRRLAELQREHQNQEQEKDRQTWQRVEETARFINLILPPGWLPLGAGASAQGDVRPALLGSLGLTLIGAASLWRAYRTTVRLYTGQFTSGRKRSVTVVAPAPPAKVGRPAIHLLERQLPGLSEHASAIALGSFRSLMRAPEAKMMLLTPILMVVIIGSMFLAQQSDPPQEVRPLMALGAMMMVLFGMVQLIGNQFGFDRSGFRVFVLCPALRRDILLGKNLSVAPLALGLGAVAAVVLEAVYPMRIDRFLAVLLQFVSMYLLFCLLANCLSILAPMPIAAGSLKPVNPKAMVILLQVAFVFLLPLAVVPALLPLGVELLLEMLGWLNGMPVFLVLSVAECIGVVFFYRLVVTWQGHWLQAREQTILQIVTTKTE
jgi:hypothetical protein